MKRGDLKLTLSAISRHVESKVVRARGLGPREAMDAWVKRLLGVTQEMTWRGREAMAKCVSRWILQFSPTPLLLLQAKQAKLDATWVTHSSGALVLLSSPCPLNFSPCLIWDLEIETFKLRYDLYSALKSQGKTRVSTLLTVKSRSSCHEGYQKSKNSLHSLECFDRRMSDVGCEQRRSDVDGPSNHESSQRRSCIYYSSIIIHQYSRNLTVFSEFFIHITPLYCL